MTNLILREGDIFDTDALAIGHGVNTVGAMGAGIALQFRTRFPAMYESYQEKCFRGELRPGGVYIYQLPHFEGQSDRFIFNIASQERPGANADYELLWQGVSVALHACKVRGLESLALPRIGSGIGGLNEQKVEGILFALARQSPIDIELWTYKG